MENISEKWEKILDQALRNQNTFYDDCLAVSKAFKKLPAQEVDPDPYTNILYLYRATEYCVKTLLKEGVEVCPKFSQVVAHRRVFAAAAKGDWRLRIDSATGSDGQSEGMGAKPGQRWT